MPDHTITYHPQMLDDLTWWLEHDMDMGAHVVELIEETQGAPERGHGRPKRLAGLPGTWSRRITQHHRLFYRLHNGELRFLSCRDHDLPKPIWAAVFNGEDV